MPHFLKINRVLNFSLTFCLDIFAGIILWTAIGTCSNNIMNLFILWFLSRIRWKLQNMDSQMWRKPKTWVLLFSLISILWNICPLRSHYNFFLIAAQLSVFIDKNSVQAMKFLRSFVFQVKTLQTVQRYVHSKYMQLFILSERFLFFGTREGWNENLHFLHWWPISYLFWVLLFWFFWLGSVLIVNLIKTWYICTRCFFIVSLLENPPRRCWNKTSGDTYANRTQNQVI